METLHTVEERAKNGLSIVIAPEGTRLDTTEVGPFKKGPFRMAMAAGIPIVPIVIRNAEIVASRNSTTINPGTVDVAVFPPIPIDDWTLDTLPERIAEVRQLYLDTLANWPVDELPEFGLYTRAKKAAPKKAAPAKARPRRREKDCEPGPRSKTAKKTATKTATRRPRRLPKPARMSPRPPSKTVRHNSPAPTKPPAPTRRVLGPEDGRDRTGRRHQRSPHRARRAGAGVHADSGRNAAGDGLAGPAAGPQSGRRSSTY